MIRIAVFLAVVAMSLPGLVNAAEPPFVLMPPESAERPEPPGIVDIEPAASDEAIAARLERILVATGWYEQPVVTVNEGGAFRTWVMRLSFWFDSRQTNGLQLRSALIRLTKRALLEAGMTIQAEQRQQVGRIVADPGEESAEAMTASEAETRPEGEVIRNQAALAPMPEQGENLLDQ